MPVIIHDHRLRLRADRGTLFLSDLEQHVLREEKHVRKRVTISARV